MNKQDWESIHRTERERRLRRLRNRKKRVQTVKRQLLFLSAGVLSCLFLLTGFGLRALAKGTGASERKLVTAHTVEAGETLFDIAGAYADRVHYASVEAYIEEVAFTNHLSDTRIHAGDVLYLPYYIKDAAE